MKYKVVEKFVSINGEGRLAGQLAIFIRFAGCNLDCSYCDTTWANEDNVSYELMTKEDIYNYIKSTKIKNITLTGGEPLLNENIIDLINFLLCDNTITIEIETNGSIDLSKFFKPNEPRLKFTMDYKLPSSNMENNMLVNNFKYLTSKDTLKFVSGNTEDLIKAKFIIEKFDLTNKTNVYISPVFGQINLSDIVQFMKNNTMNDITLQVQLHKIIWKPEERGV